LIELVTAASAAPGGRHQGLTPGKVALLCWPGEPANHAMHQGVKWLHADTWTTYQRSNFVTPAFPGYISGHSTFSRSAAEIMTAITGTHFFPGGLGDYTITNLINEQGPSAPVTLQWATYYDAADQIGISRIWGGIHPPVDDFAGRRAGAQAGQGAWNLAKKYFDGTIARTPIVLGIRSLEPMSCEVRFDAVRGFYYKLQSASDPHGMFSDDPAGFVQAFDPSLAWTNALSGVQKVYRVVQAIAP
jgi:hypothetical protein